MDIRGEIGELVREYFVDHHEKSVFLPGKTYIPAAQQVLSSECLVHLVDTALDCKFASGKQTQVFQYRLGQQFFRNLPVPILVNSGSSANLVAISSLASPRIKELGLEPLAPGDEVITVATGFPTTVAPIIQNGWVPVFVDVSLDTLNTTLEMVMAARTEKTRAVVLAHTLGNPYRADLIGEWCRENGLYLIEDCCDALGAQVAGQPVGAFGQFATLSFYPAHHISMGEGGAVIANSRILRKIAVSMRDWGRDCWCEPARDNTCGQRFCQLFGDLPHGYDHKYIYTHLGYNLKATELQASLGVSQLSLADGFIKSRRANYQYLYSKVITSPVLREHITPIEPTENTEPSWFGFPMHVGPEISRHALIEFLEKHQVGCRLVFGGNMTKQPAFQGKNFRINGSLRNSDFIMERTFWIGVHPGLTWEKMDYQIEMLERGMKEQLK